MRGLLVIGHGSRRDEANATVRELARALAATRVQDDRAGGTDSRGDARRPGGATSRSPWDAVEPAFLEVVRPDIGDGYATLARAGCSEIVVHPFFLFDGNHTSRDIPAALAAAQARHPGTTWTLTRPLGLHPGVVDAVQARIEDALRATATSTRAD